MKGTSPRRVAKLDRCTRSVADLASLIDTFSRRRVALISAAESLDTSSAGGRLVVNVLGAVAQWEREATARAHVSGASSTQGAGPGHRGRCAVRLPVHRRPPRVRGHHRAPPRRPLVGEGCRQAERHRAPHPHRRPVDAPGRPPGAPGARTRARRRRLSGARAARYEARRESPGSPESKLPPDALLREASMRPGANRRDHAVTNWATIGDPIELQ